MAQPQCTMNSGQFPKMSYIYRFVRKPSYMYNVIKNCVWSRRCEAQIVFIHSFIPNREYKPLYVWCCQVMYTNCCASLRCWIWYPRLKYYFLYSIFSLPISKRHTLYSSCLWNHDTIRVVVGKDKSYFVRKKNLLMAKISLKLILPNY